MVTLLDLDVVIAQLRKALFGDMLLDMDHNSLVDCIKIIRDLIATGGGGAEGNFTFYSKKWETDSPTGDANLDQWCCFTNGEAKVIAVDSYMNILIIDVAAGTVVDSGLDTYMSGVQYGHYSITGKYAVYIYKSPNRNAHVFKDGVKIQTLDAPDPVNDRLYAVLMSPSGKYILLGNLDYDGTDDYVLYEGS